MADIEVIGYPTNDEELEKFNTLKEKRVSDLIKEATQYQEHIAKELKDVKVPATQPHVLASIRAIFGDEYIDVINGKAFVTFEMVQQCLKIIRSVGRAKAEEL